MDTVLMVCAYRVITAAYMEPNCGLYANSGWHSRI